MVRAITVLSLAMVFSSITKADTIKDSTGQPIGSVNATIGITPMDNSGFGRFFLSYVLNGNYDAFVFWIAGNDPSGQPFTVSNGAISFLPGAYQHYAGSTLLETLDILAPSNGPYFFSINEGLYTFALASTITPDITNLSGGGDEYYINNVAVLISNVPPLPEPGTFPLLASGLVGLVSWKNRKFTRAA